VSEKKRSGRERQLRTRLSLTVVVRRGETSLKVQQKDFVGFVDCFCYHDGS
jgi:hypothetical protein